MGYCYGCGPLLSDVEHEHFRLDLCKEHTKKLKAFLSSLEPIHRITETWYMFEPSTLYTIEKGTGWDYFFVVELEVTLL